MGGRDSKERNIQRKDFGIIKGLEEEYNRRNDDTQHVKLAKELKSLLLKYEGRVDRDRLIALEELIYSLSPKQGSRKKGKPWKEKEDRLLRTYYHCMSVTKLAFLLKRSEGAIRNRANTLKLKKRGKDESQ